MPAASIPVPAPPGALTIPSWWESHETATSRKLDRPSYYLAPTGCDSNGYLTLSELGMRGLLALGVFCALCQLLGTLRTSHRRACAFLDHLGEPLTLDRIAARSRLPLDVLAEALPLLTQIGWIHTATAQDIATLPPKSQTVVSGDPTGIPPVSPPESQPVVSAPPTALVSPPPNGREGKGEERKGREGRGTPPPPPTPTQISHSHSHSPLHSHDVRSHHIEWINSLHNNWRHDVLSSPEQDAYLTARPLLDALSADERSAIAAYLAERRRLDPATCWPKRRLQFLENLPDVLTNALEWAGGAAPLPGATHAAGGRRGQVTTLSELELTDTNP